MYECEARAAQVQSLAGRYMRRFFPGIAFRVRRLSEEIDHHSAAACSAPISGNVYSQQEEDVRGFFEHGDRLNLVFQTRQPEASSARACLDALSRRASRYGGMEVERQVLSMPGEAVIVAGSISFPHEGAVNQQIAPPSRVPTAESMQM